MKTLSRGSLQRQAMWMSKEYVRLALSVIVLWGLCVSSEALAAGQQTNLDSLDSAERMSVEATVDAQIGKELGASYRELPNLLSEEAANQQGPGIQKKMLTTLEKLSKANQTGSPERRAEKLLAADRLAVHLFADGGNSPEEARERQRLTADGFEFKYLELGGGWFYMRSLLWRVWKEYGETNWGEWAFVLLLEDGWDTSQVCRNGNDQVHAVIRRGEDFLAQRPRSPRRLEVMFLVAQAYESWWSIGLLPDCRTGQKPGCKVEEAEEVNPSKFHEDAATAREKAIAYYERVLRLAPESPEGQDARRRLPLLESRKDTHQRRFYCVYD